MVEDRKLTEHFSLYELTRTDNAALQDMNRVLDEMQIGKLRELAVKLEHVRGILGVPLTVCSGYRCYALNKAVGSKPTSQHSKCEAVDFVPDGCEIDTAVGKLIESAKEGQLDFGQMIDEKASRFGEVVRWLHLSLGPPYRAPERCGEVLRMRDGIYEMVNVIR